MQRIVHCRCGIPLSIPEGHGSGPVQCPSCATILQIPESPDVPVRYHQSPSLPTATPQGNGVAVASLVLGLIGLLGWCIPLIGLPITITGLVLGIKGLKGSRPGMATAGIVLNILGLMASVVNAGIGAYMGATGQHPLTKH